MSNSFKRKLDFRVLLPMFVFFFNIFEDKNVYLLHSAQYTQIQFIILPLDSI